MIADAILDAKFTDVNVYATGMGFELNNGTISNSTITLDPGSYVYSADGGAVSVSHNGHINISNSTVVTQSYGYVVYPTGGTINITDCTIEGKEENQDKWYYIYDQYSGKTGTIIIDNVTKETKSNP